MTDTKPRRGDARSGEDFRAQFVTAPGARRAAWLLITGIALLVVVCLLLAWRINMLESDVSRLREEMKASVTRRTRAMPTPAAPAPTAAMPATAK